MNNNTWICFDFETSDPNRYSCKIDRVCVAAFDIETGKVSQRWDFREDHRAGHKKDSEVYATGIHSSELIALMASPCPKVTHTTGLDLYLMEHRLGIPVNGPIYDTYLMARHWKNDLPSSSLKTLAWILFGDTYEPLLRLREWFHDHGYIGEDDDEFDMTLPPDKLVHRYCTHDVDMTAKAAHTLYPLVKDNYAFQLDSQISRPNMELEAAGITIDTEFYEDFIRLGNRRIERNTKTAAKELGVDPKKRKPAGHALRDHLKELGERRSTPTGLVKADDVVLRDWTDDAAVRSVQRIRTDQKQVNTYAVNILKSSEGHGHFHPNLIQSSAVTRRYKSRNFHGDNGVTTKGQVQNFTRGPGIRTGIIVPEGYGFVKFDLASIEARLGSHAMSIFMDFHDYCKMYKEIKGYNIYLDVAWECQNDNKITKEEDIYTAYKHGVLGVQYGVGHKTFYVTMHDKFQLPFTFDECTDIYKLIRRTRPEFATLQRVVSSIIESQGYVCDDYGSIYYLPESEKYKGVNYYCQGCAGMVLKDWWLRCLPLLKSCKDYLFNNLHDELDAAIWLGEGKKAARKRIKRYCQFANDIDMFELPIIAEASDIVDNWGEAG